MSDYSQWKIVKPSFWKSRREIRDAADMPIAHIEMKKWMWNKADGEARGKQYTFSYDGWDSRYNYMNDMSGQRIATFEPVGWWGTQFKLTYNGKAYSWKPNGWGTGFALRDLPAQAGGETEILRVKSGGYFKPGSITANQDLPEKDLLPLVLYGLYEMQIYAANASASATSFAAIPTTP